MTIRWSILAIIVLITVSHGKTLIVDSEGTGNSTTISGAVYMAIPGDEIFIKPGTYSGATIDRSVSISGSHEAKINSQDDIVLRVTAPGCTISNLSINGRGSTSAIAVQSSDNSISGCLVQGNSTGIRVDGKNNTMIENRINSSLGIELTASGCKIFNNTFKGSLGIRMKDASDNEITGNEISTDTGIELNSSSKNYIKGNSFKGIRYGVILSKSSLNHFSENNISGQYLSGLDIVESSQNVLLANRIGDCKVGISLRGSEKNRLQNNSCQKNERAGIYTDKSSGNELLGNVLSSNGNGALIADSENNLLGSNTATGNKYGISLRGSHQNILKNNTLIGNSYNLRIDKGEVSNEASGQFNEEYFIQDIDSSNLAEGNPICYLVNKSNVNLLLGYGFIGLIGCQNITMSNQTISNSSAGILVINSTGIQAVNCSLYQSEAGIYLLNSQIWSIKSGKAEHCQIGFLFTQSKNGLLEDCAANNCSEYGFRMDEDVNITLQRSASESGKVGVSILNSRLCNLVDYSSKENAGSGIELISSHNCLLRGNIVSANERGMVLSGSNACILSINIASTNKEDGFALMQLSGADLLGNVAQGNGQGAFVQSSKNVMITGNNLSSNNRFGLRMSGTSNCNITENSFIGNQISGVNLVSCSGNLLYHNIFIDNGYQNAVDNGDNQWDAGAIIGGNYWSDHKIVGNPGNIPRQIPTNGVDRYPFQSPKGWR